MLKFYLYRVRDESGISGTGLVAEGIEFSNGQCALFWRTHTDSIGIYPSLAQVEAIHGHAGATKIVKESSDSFENQVLTDMARQFTESVLEIHDVTGIMVGRDSDQERSKKRRKIVASMAGL